MDNLEIYNKGRIVPAEAQKEIAAGKLKGFTDVNPMFRIQKMTELFGACGIGWYYEIIDKWVSEGEGIEKICSVQINLYVKQDGEWSKPIAGVGGSKFVTATKNGADTSDECFKMALTDAISVATKSLGIAADIYWQKGANYGTKYDLPDAGKQKGLDEVLKQVKDVKDVEALKALWDKFRPDFGGDPKFINAVNERKAQLK